MPFTQYEECLAAQRAALSAGKPSATPGASSLISAPTAAVVAILSQLPPANIRLLTQMIQFLNFVSRHSDTNKMTPKNLAVCFGPDVLRAKEENVLSVMKDMPVAIDFLAALIHRFDEYFEPFAQFHRVLPLKK